MLGLAALFLVIALVAFVCGFGVLGAAAIGFAKFLCFAFPLLAVMSGSRRRPRLG